MSADAFTTRFEGPSPVTEVARDLVRRGLWIAPLMMFVGGLVWGIDGFYSTGYGAALILVNFALSAFLIAATVRISLSLMMASVLFGFLIRLGVIFVAVWLVKDAGWMNMVALGVTIIVTHLGLLFWELKYVSASLAYPGLKPTVAAASSKAREPIHPIQPSQSVDPIEQSKEHSQP